MYIRDVFNDARFIDSITQHTAWLVGRSVQADSRNCVDVKVSKDLMIEFINHSIELIMLVVYVLPL